MIGCIICGEEALHRMRYERLYNDYIVWNGEYCLKHFVEKLSGMLKIYRHRLKSQ